MTEDPTPEPTDEPASAVPDPRDRRRRSDRRAGGERRGDAQDDPGQEPRGADRRRSSDRRRDVPVPEEYRGSKRQINEYPLKQEELDFINAINAYKTRYNKPFPTWSEVLHVLKSLGYRRHALPVRSEAEPDGSAD